jgi:hypothetical protein
VSPRRVAPRLALVSALWGLLLAPSLAGAQDKAAEQTLKVEVSVVLASSNGTEVDPSLQHMKQSFQKSFNFTSFKRLSQQSLEVSSTRPTEVKLPNGVNVSLRLLKLQEDKATLRVEVPQLSAVDLDLGRAGSVYRRVGPHVGGELILVFSPPGR